MNIEYHAYLVVFLYCCAELALVFYRRAGNKAQLADQGSLILIWGTISASFVLSFLIAQFFKFTDMAFLRSFHDIGVALFCSGILLRCYAIIHLGRFFTVHVAIADDHRVIDTGPYRYVRHPSYTGALLAYLGLGLCLANWLSLTVILIPPAAIILWRISIEERALRTSLGEAYLAYARKTRRLLPYVY